MVPGRGAWLAGIGLVVIWSISARADDNPPEAQSSTVEPRTWYGWQIGAADALVIGALSIDVASRSQGASNEVGIPCVTAFLVAGPIIHAAHGRWGGAAASVAYRILFPLVGTFSGGSQQGDWSNRGAARGMIAGMIAASLLDVGLAWRPLFRDQGRPATSPAVVPVFIPNPSGNAIGLGGTF
jgi:hypothetical protein